MPFDIERDDLEMILEKKIGKKLSLVYNLRHGIVYGLSDVKYHRITQPNHEISVDFGTSNSQIAYKDKAGVIRSIEVDGDAKIPTSIYYSPADKQFFFGQKAEQAYADACADAGNDFSRHSKVLSHYLSHFKLTLTKAEMPSEALSPLFGEDERQPLTWHQVLTSFFSYFRKVAEDTVFMGEKVDGLRLTHPVHFPSTELYRSAARAAGFDRLALITEPEAAHAAYSHGDVVPADNVLIFDMGGGTLDVCLLSKHGETWQVEREPLRLDTAGYHIDKALVRDLLPAINKYLKEELDDASPARAHLDYRGDAALLNHIRTTLKEPLGARHRDKVRFRYDLDRYDDLTFRMKDYTGAHLEQLAAQVMQPSFERLQRYVRELPVQPGCILMVGGSSRMLYIQERLKAIFPTIPVYTPNGGDKAVAEGALHVSVSYERLTGFEMVTEACEDRLAQATHEDIVLSL